ncbi:hypothetical protein B6U66_00990 [Candidatus Bathyarchaeota archaeon ex4484_135]|nr:MAG: hypothetical protein B6U66_00990 [Candidatus Bathyarchaeota archaeon ex4484_135]
MREIGYVMSGADHTIIPFAVKAGEKVEVGDYVLIRHPYKPDKTVLARVLVVRPYNPEMKAGRPGPHEASRGGRLKYGSWIEYRIAYAEPLGYYDEEGRWRSLECPPSTWEPVYEPSEEELKEFFKPRSGDNALLVTIGHVSKHKDIPVQVDLGEIAKGHVFICGMTRSGKSTFVVNLAISAMNLRPRPRIIIIDRRGEYSVLSEYGALVFDYRSFLPRPRDIEPGLLADILADLLGVPSGDKTIRDYIGEVVRKIRKDMSEGVDVDFTPEALEEYVERLSRAKESTKERLRLYLNKRRLSRILLLDQNRTYHDIIDVIRDHPLVVVDLSTDPNVIYQHLAVAKMIRRVVRYAIERARRKEPFAAIFVIEEAQYLAPEKGLKIEVGEPEKIGADKALVEGVSQAGGYNVGFIIMTQRPAYVMKSVISQCNTILCFRLRNPNDQDTISRYTEYGGERLTAYMPGLADFEGILCGMASTIPFPVIVETKVMEYPRKATVTAKEAWAYMDGETGGRAVEEAIPNSEPELPTVEEPVPAEAQVPRAAGQEVPTATAAEVEASPDEARETTSPEPVSPALVEAAEESKPEVPEAGGELRESPGKGEEAMPAAQDREASGEGEAKRRRRGKPIIDLFEPVV